MKNQIKIVEEIEFALAKTSLGLVLAAQSHQGLCAVLLGYQPEALKRDLQICFTKAQLVEKEKIMLPWLSKVIQFIEDPSQKLDMALDRRGTDFQQNVWENLLDIPFGSTATYTDIAKKIGSPYATRAVAQACAANTLAIVIPCHRVVRSDGALAGYRWGIELKRHLIDRESLNSQLELKI